ncbi:putative baseplate J-like protein [Pseudomonas phage PPpW-3]|uniref:Putative baseplate J-like protein n=1 Tax=Pseudomonas phage PPpW-3 TaxID=1279082 RepID=V5YTH6_9CAUD|nr:baseplate protein [Pseudomonas phage PPpW-3]BAO20613.1 putative baseplate J-like protein [Pseudomonas phage PPpW-3]
MAGAFTAVDLSKLPFPAAVEPLDFETILAAMVADLQARDPAFSALLESDPAFKILEVAAFREFLMRQRVNEAIKALTLAYAMDADLDQIAARYNVQRLTLVPENQNTIPPTPAVMESNESLRRRVQLSFEGFSTAGPEGAYVFHSLGADARVLDASAYGPPETPGVVKVAVLSREGDGTAPPDLIAAVNATLSAKDVRPLTDNVQVQSAAIISYSVTAALTLYEGPDAEVVLAAAQSALAAYTEANHRLGRDVTLSGIYAALHQEGVQSVNLISPNANIVTDWSKATYCTGTTITVAGTDE